MECWQGKVAVVTGASAGIGSAISAKLANSGLTVVGLARRANLVDELKSKVTGPGCIMSQQCDVGNPESVATAFRWIEDTLGCFHVLVNNAGVFQRGQCTDFGENPVSEEVLMSTIDVNLKGPVLCTRHAVNSMKRHGVAGHVLVINSIVGHYVPFMPEYNVYTTSKHGVTAYLRTLANELAAGKACIRISSISPGRVATAMASLTAPDRMHLPALDTNDVVDAVIYALSAPLTVNVDEVMITPVRAEIVTTPTK